MKSPERITPVGYLIMNLLFWGFCLAQYLIAKTWLKGIEGISIFFLALAAGFTIVCVFDILCGFLDDEEDDEKAESAEAH